MKRIVTSMFALVGLFVVPLALADSGPSVGYSAYQRMETKDAVTEGQVYYMPGKERREIGQEGNKTVMIIRHDKKAIWSLMPADEMYIEMKFPKEGRSDDISAYKIDAKTVGPDTVNGIETTKKKVIMTAPDGTKMGGFMWVTKEGITVKSDVIAADKNSKERFKIELTNLKIGKQKDSLFEIPKGYARMSMGNLGAMMMGGDDGDSGDDAANDDGDDDGDNGDAASPQQEKKKGFGWKDAIDLMR